MWHDLWVASALLLVIEGILPFLSPATLREMARNLLELDDATLRIGGFISMIAGLGLLYLVN
ncbi:MAG TPA: DUF2065 domain-containing protein [Chromatiaceae bacterium]|nr:DUF2065 domain-containing protein [Chromatiaceae bacterium]